MKCKKKTYKTMEQAWPVVSRMVRQQKKNIAKDRGGFLKPYHCTTCGKIHIGNKKTPGSLIRLIERAVDQDMKNKEQGR